VTGLQLDFLSLVTTLGTRDLASYHSSPMSIYLVHHQFASEDTLVSNIHCSPLARKLNPLL